MNIALVNKFIFENGGQESVMLEDAKLLTEAGHTVAFWGMQHPRLLPNLPYQHTFAPQVDFSSPGKRLSLGQKLSLARRFVRSPQAAQGFAQFIQAFKPDVIHVHGIAHQLTPSILQVAQQHHIPVVQTVHDYQLICPAYTLLRGDGTVCESVSCQTEGKGFMPCITHTCIKGSKGASVLNAVEMAVNAKPAVQWVSHFIAPSQFMARLLTQHGVGPVTHITNTIAPPPPALKPDGVPPHYAMFAGRLSHEKGLDTLLEAAISLPELPLLIVGDGPERDRLKAKAAHAPHIQWLGFNPRSEVIPLLAHASAMILPSEWYENLPVSIIEAQMMGTPVITANIGGLPEMVQHQQTGWLFNSRDVAGLRACMQDLVNNPEKSAQYGQAGLAFAQKQYGPATHLQQLQAVYQQVLTQKHGG
jgi:glycosyltransferase involved in cell wall biosynthesis